MQRRALVLWRAQTGHPAHTRRSICLHPYGSTARPVGTAVARSAYMLQMNACWSAVYNAAGAASLLGALPLDVYRVIFCALDYATLRDSCRSLNTALGPVALQTLRQRRYEPVAAAADHTAQPIRCSFDPRAFCTRWCTHWCNDCNVSVCAACALPLGGFMLALCVRCRTHDIHMFLLASFSARGRLERVWPLTKSLCMLSAYPVEDYNEIGLKLPLRECTVLQLYAFDRHMYLFLRYNHSHLYVMVRCARDDISAAPRVLCVSSMLASAVPRVGPARWKFMEVLSCAVASTQPLRFALFCRGSVIDTLDQAVLLEVDADLHLYRALTLTTPTEELLPGYGAPWPSRGLYRGLDPCFHVDAYGRYVFSSALAGDCASLLLFEPQHGLLLACVPLPELQLDAPVLLLGAAEPQRNVCVYQRLTDRALHVDLPPPLVVVVAPSRVRCIPFAQFYRRAVLLEDGYRLDLTLHTHDACLSVLKYAV